MQCYSLGEVEFYNLCKKDFYENSKFYIDGPCVIWTLWFLDMRLTNKHLSYQEVLKKALEVFRKNHQLVCKVIMNYGVFAHKITKKYDLIVDDKNNTVEIVYKKTPQNNRILKMILGSLTSVAIMSAILYKNLKKYHNH